ncbi:hypothetical protein EVAR_49560_1 [Eumeta japonica]|uniref:Uncharacterized protein n=1 Tax=Eumeta variegata TaxID=151549 RepID=A0A4C1XMQ4_EUMVA|nr:hypothetical protein EVAR_49560_1 [Eumeta japonica]
MPIASSLRDYGKPLVVVVTTSTVTGASSPHSTEPTERGRSCSLIDSICTEGGYGALLGPVLTPSACALARREAERPPGLIMEEASQGSAHDLSALVVFPCRRGTVIYSAGLRRNNVISIVSKLVSYEIEARHRWTDGTIMGSHFDIRYAGTTKRMENSCEIIPRGRAALLKDCRGHLSPRRRGKEASADSRAPSDCSAIVLSGWFNPRPGLSSAELRTACCGVILDTRLHLDCTLSAVQLNRSSPDHKICPQSEAVPLRQFVRESSTSLFLRVQVRDRGLMLPHARASSRRGYDPDGPMVIAPFWGSKFEEFSSQSEIKRSCQWVHRHRPRPSRRLWKWW